MNSSNQKPKTLKSVWYLVTSALLVTFIITTSISCTNKKVLILAKEDPYSRLNTAEGSSVAHLVVFGNEQIYALYQPTSGGTAPYQAVFEITLHHNSKEAISLYQLDRARTHTRSYSLKPEQFIFDELLTLNRPYPLRTNFKATLFRGLFWEGGEPVLQDIQVNIRRIILQTKFQNASELLPFLSYYTFGNARELFAVHLANDIFDFKHLLKLSISEGVFDAKQASRIQDGRLMIYLNKPNEISSVPLKGDLNQAAVQLEGGYLSVRTRIEESIAL